MRRCGGRGGRAGCFRGEVRLELGAHGGSGFEALLSLPGEGGLHDPLDGFGNGGAAGGEGRRRHA